MGESYDLTVKALDMLHSPSMGLEYNEDASDLEMAVFTVPNPESVEEGTFGVTIAGEAWRSQGAPRFIWVAIFQVDTRTAQ